MNALTIVGGNHVLHLTPTDRELRVTIRHRGETVAFPMRFFFPDSKECAYLNWLYLLDSMNSNSILPAIKERPDEALLDLGRVVDEYRAQK